MAWVHTQEFSRRPIVVLKDSITYILGDIEDDDRPSTRTIREGAFAGRKEILDRDAKKHMLWIDHEVIPLLLPLANAGKGIGGVLAGHHWYKLTDSKSGLGMTSTEYICKRLTALSGREVPYLGIMSSWVWLIFHSHKGGKHGPRKLMHIQHGVGGGGTLGAALNRLIKTKDGRPADIYVRGHDCQLVAAKQPEITPKYSQTPELLTNNILYLNLGSATQGYTITKDDPNYAELAMMRPGSLGWGCIHLRLAEASRAVDRNHNFTVSGTI